MVSYLTEEHVWFQARLSPPLSFRYRKLCYVVVYKRIQEALEKVFMTAAI